MTIRYQCPDCESVLKIRDDKAGTKATCPGCKAKFIVPEPTDRGESETLESAAPEEKVEHPPKGQEKAVKKPVKIPEKAGKKADSDDFDPAAFLMEDGPGAKASAGLTEKPAQPEGPLTDKQGRRLYNSGASSAARRASMSPAAAAADENLNASANARELLSKTADESRVRAASMPPQEKKPPLIDLTGAKDELKRFAPHLAGGLGAFLLFWYFMHGLLNPGPDLPPLGYVSGTVTVNGKPLAGVTVNFEPIDANSPKYKDGPKRIRNAQGVTDEDGYYELSYMQGISGAPIGKGYLWLSANSAADVKKIPPGWGGRGNTVYEVREAGNDGRFNITIEQ